jgi:hypothetical protein
MTPFEIEKSRKEFEQYIGGSAARIGDDYFNDLVNYQWKAWQVSRESLVVELPKTQEHKNNDQPAMTNMKSGFNVCIGEMKQSLQSAGINYRERE